MTSSISSSEKPSPTPPAPVEGRRFPLAFALAVALALPIELGAWLLPQKAERVEDYLLADGAPGIDDTIVQAKLDHARGDAPPVDLLVLGDSSGLMGVDSQALERATGLETYNLCTIGWLGVEGHLLLLVRYLETRPAPRIVVYHFAPTSLALTGEEIERFGLLQRLRTALDPRVAKSDTLVDELSWPSARFRPVVARWLNWESTREKYDVVRGDWPSHREMTRLLVDDAGSLQERNVTDWEREKPPVAANGASPAQAEALRRLVELSESRGFDLLFVANPIPEIADTPNNRAALASLETDLRAITGDSARVSILSPFVRVLPDERLATLTHLRPEAVGENVDAIAKWIKAR